MHEACDVIQPWKNPVPEGQSSADYRARREDQITEAIEAFRASPTPERMLNAIRIFSTDDHAAAEVALEAPAEFGMHVRYCDYSVGEFLHIRDEAVAVIPTIRWGFGGKNRGGLFKAYVLGYHDLAMACHQSAKDLALIATGTEDADKSFSCWNLARRLRGATKEDIDPKAAIGIPLEDVRASTFLRRSAKEPLSGLTLPKI